MGGLASLAQQCASIASFHSAYIYMQDANNLLCVLQVHFTSLDVWRNGPALLR